MASEQSQRRPSWSLVRNPEQAEIYEVLIMPIAVCSISVCRQKNFQDWHKFTFIMYFLPTELWVAVARHNFKRVQN